MRLHLLLSIFSLALHVLSLPVPGGSDGDAQDLIYREETDFDFGERGFGDEGLYDLEERSAQPSIDNSEPSLYRKETSISGEAGLQPRAAGAIIEGVQMLVEGIMAIVNHIKEKVQHDKNMRSTWTQWLIQECVKKRKGWDYLVVHVKHKMKAFGTKGKDWFHKHFEFKNTAFAGTTTGYELYGFRKGADFERKGDGGYLNWAYQGHVKSKAKGGAVVHFGPASR